MKTLLLTLLLAVSAHAQTVEVYNIAGKQDDSTWKNQAIRVNIYDNIRYGWLVIGRFDYTPKDLKGFNAGYTYVASRFKPVITEYPNHLYIITFTTEKF
jgi:hypothetical protein